MTEKNYTIKSAQLRLIYLLLLMIVITSLLLQSLNDNFVLNQQEV